MRALAATCLLLLTPAIRAQALPAQREAPSTPPGGPEAGAADAAGDDPVDPAAAGLPDWLPSLVVDEDSDLYLAQVVAGIGTEGLFGVCGLCLPLALGAGVVKPAAGALAVDWVGRELGGYQGWQVGALVASYGLQLAGSGLVLAGVGGLYLSGIVGSVVASTTGDAASTAVSLSMLGASLGTLGLGGIVLLARPWLVPLVWSFTLEEPAASDDGGAPPGSVEPDAAGSTQPVAPLVVPPPDPSVREPAPETGPAPDPAPSEVAP